MHEENNQMDFPALLKNPKGEVLAEGHATITPGSRSADFKSDFVPLYPMGTKLEIIRTYKGKPIHRFFGEVYLSGKQLLRLVSLSDQLLPVSREVYFSKTELPAELKKMQITQPARKKWRLLSFWKKQPSGPQVWHIRITAISTRQIEFTTTAAIEVGDRFWMTPDFPSGVGDMPVVVRKVYDFGIEKSCRAEFENMEDSSALVWLETFVRPLNEMQNRLFPPDLDEFSVEPARAIQPPKAEAAEEATPAEETENPEALEPQEAAEEATPAEETESPEALEPQEAAEESTPAEETESPEALEPQEAAEEVTPAEEAESSEALEPQEAAEESTPAEETESPEASEPQETAEEATPAEEAESLEALEPQAEEAEPEVPEAEGITSPDSLK